ncbi:TetR/AcrR family transcriptional regulator [Amycolatopsis sp. FDAARGOS 1241]|uniref:TetR/AcrR family transcriptional regulator n=1 Tax=Amycolatopsis sp. FDAARGOS 1241 TaxID=2778070 RepID=UPI001951B57F|nr:TetR family transcriptional regulator [Amycolatopsis sp. FDAARGOS 1241]QRP48134.1 TetR family transcriptional regulator [Amycolatopsis sp. FDAARGOS 1241]
MPSSSSRAGNRPRSRAAAGLPAVTAEKVVDAAVALTAERGLDNWTLRQLAAAVDAYPAVIYHHVGDRDAVVSAVLDRVVGLLTLPDDDLPWQDWFAELLTELRTVLRSHPGTARRLVLFGPSVDAAARTVDRGIGVLLDAGFGEESVLAYNLLVATACQFVAMEDDRDGTLALRLDNTEEYAGYRDRTDLPGMAAHGRAMHALINDPDLAARWYTRLYDYAVQRCLDGLTHRLAELGAEPPA